MPDINVKGGGIVYFYVSPFFTGETGNYLLDLNVTKSVVTGIEEPELLKVIHNEFHEGNHSKICESAAILFFACSGEISPKPQADPGLKHQEIARKCVNALRRSSQTIVRADPRSKILLRTK